MLTTEKLIRALRARGKSDSLAQWAADEIERRKPAPSPDGFIITERVVTDFDGYMVTERVGGKVTHKLIPVADLPPAKSAPAKKAPAKKAKR